MGKEDNLFENGKQADADKAAGKADKLKALRAAMDKIEKDFGKGSIMDCSLNEPNYMGFGYEEALVYALQLIEKVTESNGELILLWHNDAVATNAKLAVSVDWHRTFFNAIIKELKEE